MKNYISIIDGFFSNKASGTLFVDGRKLSPLAFMGISDTFPDLAVKNEDVLVCHKLDISPNKYDLVLTSQNIYINFSNEKTKWPLKEFIALGDEEQLKILSFLNETDNLELLNLIRVLNEPSKNIDKKDFNYLVGRLKSMVNEESARQNDFEIDIEYLKILDREGIRIEDLCRKLNNDNAFMGAVNMVLKNEDAIEYNAEHILLQDIINVFNKITSVHTSVVEIPLKSKFFLAYLFERIQGRNMSSSLSVERINKMVNSEKFDENIEKIAKASFFSAGDNYKNEYLVPSILKRIDGDLFESINSSIYRIASLFAKADGTISEKEEELLKSIIDKLNNPKQKIVGVVQTEIEQDDSLEKVLEELNSLIGLENVKQSVQDLINFLKIQKIRAEKGFKSSENVFHSVFMGPPGTGKTTVARLLGRVYKHIGFLEKGHLVETDRAGLVAGYVGQTAIKVDEVVKSAIGGVLFIDEAYSLANTGSQKDFGSEAIETLLKRMEDHRNDLVVIVAGYPDEMEEFIKSNPGLQSRFNRYYNFDHFKAEEMIRIIQLFAKNSDFNLSVDANDKLLEIFDRLYEKRHKAFGNARVVRNLFEKIIERQANRIVAVAPLTDEILLTLTHEDVPPILETVKEIILFGNEQESENSNQ
ncbi:MAG: AAA family ATPase [Cyclobacteriaceae bacterium]|nr:AAA family ATPase [Cyclobacteriaceae bacterium]